MLFDVSKSRCETNQKIVVCEENKVKHVTKNPNGQYKIYKYKIDGDIVSSSDSELRCDYIVEVDRDVKKDAFLIELKGSDVEHAIEQIKSTISRYRSKLTSYIIRPRIIYRSNVHQIRVTKMRQFKKDYPLTEYTKNCYEDDLSRI